MILVFGKSGQVATELARLGEEITCLGRDSCDLSIPGAAREAITVLAPSAVINASAYTAVDKAELEEALATQINGHAVAEMADACAAVGVPLVHISTDYVFSGMGNKPFAPSDPVAPVNAYGRSKLAGETAIARSKATAVILRSSWVVSLHGNNFLKTILRLGAERDMLTIVADQIGGPTPAANLAAACLGIANELKVRPHKSGTYHFAGVPDVSWADFARSIFDQAGLNCQVTDISSSDYPTAVQRPLNSRMDCTSLEDIFSIPRPDWRVAIADILKEWINEA